MHQAQSHFHQERLILSTSTFSTKKQLSLKVQFSSFEDLNFLSPTLISSMSTKLRQLDETDKREKGKLCKYHPVNALQLVNTRKQYIQHTKHQMKIRGEIHEVMLPFFSCLKQIKVCIKLYYIVHEKSKPLSIFKLEKTI